MSEELVPIEGEIVQQESHGPMNLLGSSDPEEALSKAEAVAVALDKRVRQRKLFTKMGQKDHLHVEAWTMLGSLLGVFPVIVWTRPLEEEGRLVGWEARAEARTIAGATVGGAESECRFEETTYSSSGKASQRWKSKPSTELRGMAQTRAISRAMRAPLGFVAELAGYAATPEAEMSQNVSQDAEASQEEAKITKPQHAKIGALLNELEEIAPTHEGQLSWVAQIRERARVRSRADLTKVQAGEIIEWLEGQKEAVAIPFDEAEREGAA